MAQWKRGGPITHRSQDRNLAPKRPRFVSIDERKGRRESFVPFLRGGCSSDGRALALHARGTGIDAPQLQSISVWVRRGP